MDNDGEPSADRIVPEWQSLTEGQRLNSMRNDRNWMTVAVLEPNRTLVLRSNYELPSGRTFEPRSGPLPRAYVDAIWGFHPKRHQPSLPQQALTRFGLLLGEPLHFAMQTRQFHNLRSRLCAEAHRAEQGNA